jgi:transposase
MLAITPQMRILVAVEAVDFRKGIDSLAESCRQKLDTDPFSGYLFVFRSRRATSIKVLVYDGQGFWLATKRLSKGRFRWWPRMTAGAEEPARVLRAHQAAVSLRRRASSAAPSSGASSNGRTFARRRVALKHFPTSADKGTWTVGLMNATRRTSQ